MGSVENMLLNILYISQKKNMFQKKDEMEDTTIKNDIKNLGMEEVALTPLDFPSKRREKSLVRCYLWNKNM